MTAPVSNHKPIIYSEQEKPKCDVCQVDKVTRMLFYAIYGKSYNFCSENCLRTWVFSKAQKS